MPSGKPEGNMRRTTEAFGVPGKRHLPTLTATILSFGKPEGNMWRTTEAFGVPEKRHLPPLNATILSF